MSTVSRVRKSSPVKQGPMRATIPMSSLLRQNTNTNTNTATGTNWRCRSSPDNTNTGTSTTCTSSGQRSPGSVSVAYNKGIKCKAGDKGPGNIIRRTASLDTIYLKGQWPRDTFYFHCGLLQVDKATQTEEPSSVKCFRNVADDSPSPSSSSSSTCFNDDKCFHRQRQQQQQRTSKERTTTTTTKAIPIIKPIPMIKPPMRNSIEGLNQEIERLVLNPSSNTYSNTNPNSKLRSANNSNNSMEKEDLDLDLHLNLNVNLEQMTPEGHRAPLADLFRCTRSVNTQTPAGPFENKNKTTYSNSNSNSNSNSANTSANASDSSSPDDDPLYNSSSSSSRFFSTSPHINRFLAREPPDGCERVNLRFYEDTGTNTLLNPPNVNVTFELKPSLGSAFQPLNHKFHHDTNTNNTSNDSNNTQILGDKK